MNRRAVLAIARKDIQAITANLQVWLPMLIVPLLLGLVLPAVMVVALRFGGESATGSDLESMVAWVEQMPPGPLATKLDQLPSLTHRLIYLAANYMLAPFFLLIPLMTASIISADSFAGEKERGTLESLLFAPVEVRALFTGKVLASLIPAIALSLLTFLLSAISLNLLAWPLFHGPFFPQVNWIPLMLLVIPTIAMLAVLVNVFISARVASFQAAYQLGGVVVLPILLLVAGQATGLLIFDWVVVSLVGLFLAFLDLVLLMQVMRRLNRSQLFTSQIR